MSGVSTTVRARLTPPTTPTVYNVVATLANTEYSQTLTNGTKMFTIKVRGNAQLQLAFASGDSGVLFVTVPPGATYTNELIEYTGTLYFQVNKASQIVEIVEWSG